MNRHTMKTKQLTATGQDGIGQNGRNKMVAISIDSNPTELNFYSATTGHI